MTELQLCDENGSFSGFLRCTSKQRNIGMEYCEIDNGTNEKYFADLKKRVYQIWIKKHAVSQRVLLLWNVY